MNTQLNNILEKQVNIKVRDLLIIPTAWLFYKGLQKVYRGLKLEISHSRVIKAAKQSRQQRDQIVNSFVIPKPNLDDEFIDRITRSDISQLKKLLENGEVTSVDLVNIFADRCQKYGIKYEIITHLKYNEAIEQAKECDEKRKNSPEACKGHLFGIPISIKESFLEKDYPSTSGCSARVNRVEQEDGINAKQLKANGAILLVRTNVPQLLMTFESINNIYGTSQNPWDKTKSPGGSSGGEGAAISGRLSVAGLGSDIAGSVRNPAGMCGIYGLKPGTHRSIEQGEARSSEAFDGQRTIPGTSGFLGKSVEDLVLMFKSMMNPEILQSRDKSEIPSHNPILPIRDEVIYNQKKNRKFGYFKTLSAMDSASCQQRAVELAVQSLREQGHECVEIDIPFSEELHQIANQVYFGDGFEIYKEVLEGEKEIDIYTPLFNYCRLSKFDRKLKSFFYNQIGEQRLKRTVDTLEPINLVQNNRVSYQVFSVISRMLQIFDDNKIEAIICPSFVSCALPHGYSKISFLIFIYTFMWNICNFPAGVLPVTTVREDEQHYKNSKIQDSISKNLHNLMTQNTQGLPVNVQVVSTPYNEEVVLNVMSLIDSQIQFYKNHKLPDLN
ncbi:hypothetical protein ABPG74_005972 [Tetrahymena malaccensis]